MAWTKPFNNPDDKVKNRIYHFCRLETAVNHILPHLKLRISPLKNTNDPRENKGFVFAGLAGPGIEIGKLEDRNIEISEILLSDCKVLCFSEDLPYGLFGYELSRMWAHYGGNHKGVCIELDKELFIEENNIDPKYFKNVEYYQFDNFNHPEHKQVNYNELHSLGKEKYIKDVFRHTHMDFLYFTKNIEWESEHEIRLIRFSDNLNDEYCSIKKSIKNIFTGVDFVDKDVDSLIKVCPQIDISKMEYQETRMHPNEIYKGVS